MTAASALVFPGSRTLAGWWKQLAPLQPHAIWIAHLPLHHVEAVVALRQPASCDSLARFVLKALALRERTRPEELDQHLHVGVQLARQALNRLHEAGLADSDSRQTWSLTTLGREALTRGSYPRISQERQIFHFVESGLSSRWPHYLPLRLDCCIPCPAPENWGFPVEVLEACLAQPDSWKKRYGFPQDIFEVLAGSRADQLGPSEEQSLQRVVLARAERLSVVIAQCIGQNGSRQVLGLPVQPEGWVLQTTTPAFQIGDDGREVVPELAEEIPRAGWWQAWRAWAQPRNLPAAEVEACGLELVGYRLRVSAPARLIERLRVARSDALKGEAWLLAGTGRVRSAGLIELIEREPRG